MQALITSTDKIPKPHQAQLMGTPTKRGGKGRRGLHCNLAAITFFLPYSRATSRTRTHSHGQTPPRATTTAPAPIAAAGRSTHRLRRAIFPNTMYIPYHIPYIYMYSIYIYICHTIPFPVLPLPSGIAPPRIAFSLVCQTLQLHVPCAMYTPVYPRNCASSKQVQPCVFAVNQYS